MGSKYALMDAKLILFAVLAKLSVQKCSRTPEKITNKMSGSGFKEEIWVMLKLRK